MYQLIEEDNELKLKCDNTTENIHLIHCNETLAEINEDVAIPYIVAEHAGNSPRLHLITSFSEDEALQEIDEYLTEQEQSTDHHLFGVLQCEIINA